jgi:hypothetical protein
VGKYAQEAKVQNPKIFVGYTLASPTRLFTTFSFVVYAVMPLSFKQGDDPDE